MADAESSRADGSPQQAGAEIDPQNVQQCRFCRHAKFGHMPCGSEWRSATFCTNHAAERCWEPVGHRIACDKFEAGGAE